MNAEEPCPRLVIGTRYGAEDCGMAGEIPDEIREGWATEPLGEWTATVGGGEDEDPPRHIDVTTVPPGAIERMATSDARPSPALREAIDRARQRREGGTKS